MKKSETLKAEMREKLGTRGAKKLRAEGRIPASITSDTRGAHLDFHIDAHHFMTTRRHHTHLYEIEFGKGGGAGETAVVRELQWDTFGESIIHIEFKRVQRDVKTESEVELEFVGHPKGGQLNHLRTRVKISCIPSLIPDSIEVQVGGFEPGHMVYARDLVIPAGVDLVTPPETKIANVVLQKVEEVAPPAAAPEAAAAATPAAPATPAPGA